MLAQRDPRLKHLRLLRRRRTSARMWTVWAASVASAAAVAIPYAGVGWLDIVWAWSAGGSIAMTVLRWRDYRVMAAMPVPAPPPPPQPGQSLGQRLAPLVGPMLGPMIDRPKRLTVRPGSLAAPLAQRLNTAARALPPLLDRLGPSAGDTWQEAHAAHLALRELSVKIDVVERSLAVSPPEAHESLVVARTGLVSQFSEGVDAYERLTASAAECVAALARGGDKLAATRLTEASDALSGLAGGLTEMKDRNAAYGLSG